MFIKPAKKVSNVNFHELFNIDSSNYTVEKKISTGIASEIYKVKDKYENVYAAKVIKSDNETDILNEINYLTECQNPTIIKYYGCSFKDFEDNDNHTIFMDYAVNGSLFEHIKDNKLTNTQRQIILAGIAYGMAFIHKNKIIHLDLKPLNVLLDKNYYPLITDFGISKKNSRKNTFINGTCNYMAPELFKDDIIFNEKADVYSFGILMYEVVSKLEAFKNSKKHNWTCYSVPKEVLNGYRPKFKHGIKRSLKNLIKRCWSDDISLRPSFEEIFVRLTENNKSYHFDKSKLKETADEYEEEEEEEEERAEKKDFRKRKASEYDNDFEDKNKKYHLDGVDVSKLRDYIKYIKNNEAASSPSFADELNLSGYKSINDLRRIKTKKEEETVHAISEMELLQKNYDSLKIDYQKLKDEFNTLEKKLKSLQKKYDRVTEEKEDLETETENIRKENKKLKKENKNLEEQIENLEEQIVKLEEQNEEFDEQNRNLRNENNNLDEQNQNLKTENENLNEQNQNLREENRNIEEQSRNLREVNQNLEEESQHLREESQNIREESENRVTDAINRKKNLENINRQLIQENQDITKSLNDLTIENTLLKQKSQPQTKYMIKKSKSKGSVSKKSLIMQDTTSSNDTKTNISNFIFKQSFINGFNTIDLPSQKVFISEVIKKSECTNLNNLLTKINDLLTFLLRFDPVHEGSNVIQIYTDDSNKAHSNFEGLFSSLNQIYIKSEGTSTIIRNECFKLKEFCDIIEKVDFVVIELVYNSDNFDEDFDLIVTYLKTVKIAVVISNMNETDLKFKDNKIINYVRFDNNVTRIKSNSFSCCTSLKRAYISPKVKFIGTSSFLNCTSLSFLSIPSSVETIEAHAFEGCTQLKEVRIENSVKSIKACGFCGCVMLSKIKMPTSIQVIERQTFFNCRSLRFITITAKVSRIDEEAFANCESLVKIEFVSYIKSNDHDDVKLAIGQKSFQNCKKLEPLKFPSQLDSIAESAFEGCEVMNAMTFNSLVTSIGKNAFLGCGVEEVTVPPQFLKKYNTIFNRKNRKEYGIVKDVSIY